jgi:hypothetical protein
VLAGGVGWNPPRYWNRNQLFAPKSLSPEKHAIPKYLATLRWTRWYWLFGLTRFFNVDLVAGEYICRRV